MEFIRDLCSGGVSRALRAAAAVHHLRPAKAFDRTAVKEAVVSFKMPEENLQTLLADKNILKICYELAWWKISFPETAELACDRISAVVARLNIHIAKEELASSRGYFVETRVLLAHHRWWLLPDLITRARGLIVGCII